MYKDEPIIRLNLNTKINEPDKRTDLLSGSENAWQLTGTAAPDSADKQQTADRWKQYDTFFGTEPKRVTTNQKEAFSRAGAQTQVTAPKLPERYALMRAISRDRTLRAGGPGRVFYEQARFMEAYEDDFTPASWRTKECPASYNGMDDTMLRMYFTWRTKYKKGLIGKFTTYEEQVFVQVYANELILGVGTMPGEEALQKLTQLAEKTAPFSTFLSLRINRWIADYKVYHGIADPQKESLGATSSLMVLLRAQQARLAHTDSHKKSEDAEISNTLLDGLGKQLGLWPLIENLFGKVSDPDDSQLFDAMLACTSTRVRTSRFFKDYYEEACRVGSLVYKGFVDYCEKHRKKGFFQGLFGEPFTIPYQVFMGAFFYDPKAHQDIAANWSATDWLICKNNRWFRVTLMQQSSESNELSNILAALDYTMRQRWNYKYRVIKKEVPRFQQQIIDRAIDAYLEQKRASEVVPVEFNFAELGSIRSAAVKTMESLLVDEERDSIEQAPAEKPAIQEPLQNDVEPMLEKESSEQSIPAQAPAFLDPEEAAFLKSLLENKQLSSMDIPQGISIDMLVDRLNEKFFDHIGDTIIEFDGLTPQLIEDYREDIRQYLE
ncbi:MAG: TerB N-terminal domain-containing protein [Coriobacteriales bacterium]|nr:TerB N-terminal domain-containing protein [Coriobacteriales bacterium]